MRRLSRFLIIMALAAIVMVITSPRFFGTPQVALAVAPAGSFGSDDLPGCSAVTPIVNPTDNAWDTMATGDAINVPSANGTPTLSSTLNLRHCESAAPPPAVDPILISSIVFENGPASVGATWGIPAFFSDDPGTVSIAAPSSLAQATPGFYVQTSCASTTPGVYSNALLVTTDSPAVGTVYRFPIDCVVNGPGLNIQGYQADGVSLVTPETLLQTNGQTYDLATITTADDVPLNNHNVLRIANNNAAPAGATNLVVDVNWEGNLQVGGVDNPSVSTNVLQLNLAVPVVGQNIVPNTHLDIAVTCDPTQDATWTSGISAARVYSRTFSVVHNYPAGGAPQPSNKVTYRVHCSATPTPNYDTSDPTADGIVINNAPVGTWTVSQVNDFRIINNGHSVLNVRINPLTTTELRAISNPADPNSIITNFTVQPGASGYNLYIACRPNAPVAVTSPVQLRYDANQPGVGGSAIITEFNATVFNITCNGISSAPNLEARRTETNQVLDITPDFNGISTVNLGQSPIGIPGDTGTISLRNIGTTFTGIAIATDPASDVADFTLDTTTTQFGLQPNDTTTFKVTCRPAQPNARQLIVNITSQPAGGFPDKQLNFQCVGSTGGSAMNVSTGTQILTNAAPFSTVTISNPGTDPTNVTSISLTGANASIFSLRTTTNEPLTFGGTLVPGNNGTYAFNVACLDTTGQQGRTADLVIISAEAGTKTLTFTCNNTAINPPVITATPNPSGPTNTPNPSAPTNTPVGGAATYNSTPAAGSTISMVANLNEDKTSEIVITAAGNPGATLNISTVELISAVNIRMRSQTGDPTLRAGNSDSKYTIVLSCQSGSAGTFTGDLTVTHSGGVAKYSITCTVGSVTATPGAGTAVATIDTAAVTTCPANLVLSTPLPQNATGEFLLVNCFSITGPGAISIPLTQLLTATSSSVRSADLEAIRSNAALISFWRMGSWFLVPSEYNPATQTYTFTAAAGPNVYGVFYGAITRPVGAQNNASFAGTTTGNVHDVLVKDDNPSIFVGIIASLFVLFVGAIYFTRRQQRNKVVSE